MAPSSKCEMLNLASIGIASDDAGLEEPEEKFLATGLQGGGRAQQQV